MADRNHDLRVLAPGCQLEDLEPGVAELVANEFDGAGWSYAAAPCRWALSALLSTEGMFGAGYGPWVNTTAEVSRLSGVNRATGVVEARRTGNAHGAHFEWRGLEHIEFSADLRGACAAYFCHQEAPRIGAFWHSLYDYDYVFVSGARLDGLLSERYRTTSDDPRLERFKPLLHGMVVKRIDHQISLANFAHSDTGGLFVRTLTLNVEGDVLGSAKELVMKSLTRTFY